MYPYLTERAAARLAEARTVARAAGITERPPLVPLGGNRLAVLPWCGSRRLPTMALRLSGVPGIRGVSDQGFYLELTADASQEAGVEGLAAALGAVVAEPWSGEAMVTVLDRAFCERAKSDVYLPDVLLKRSFVADHLDVAGAAERFLETAVPA